MGVKNAVGWLEKQPAEQSASEEKRVRSDYFHLMWLHAVRFTIRRLIEHFAVETEHVP